MTKLIDRCHNVSSMAGTFSVEKLKSYIDETRHYVLPLLRKVKNRYPEDSDILFVLKYPIVSVVDSIDATIRVFEYDRWRSQPHVLQQGHEICTAEVPETVFSEAERSCFP